MELLARFVRGDIDAFEDLFRQFQSQVYHWILRIVRDRGVAEDLTIETFWRIHRARARFDPEREFEPWARRVATNVALDHLKNVRNEVPLTPAHEPSVQQGSGTEHEIRKAVEQALRALPAKLQVVATLVLIEEMPYAVVAETLGLSINTVKSREFRAIRLLRQKLRRWGVSL